MSFTGGGALYVRVKRIGSKRYAYLAEGRSVDGKVRQKTLAYLGPLVKMARGVPDVVVRRVDRGLGRVEWDRINVSIRDIPLTFEEWQEVKRDMLPQVLARRQDRARDEGRDSRPRIEGELAALTLIARKRFNEMFETLKDGTLVMR
jgi:hypothetical protein